MNAKLHKLAAIAALLEPGALPDAEREWLLEQSAGPGQRKFGTIQRLQRRNELLCEAADKFWPDAGPTEQARRMHEALARYAVNAWGYERALVECPEKHRGTSREYFWKILKEIDAPLSASRIRAVLPAS